MPSAALHLALGKLRIASTKQRCLGHFRQLADQPILQGVIINDRSRLHSLFVEPREAADD